MRDRLISSTTSAMQVTNATGNTASRTKYARLKSGVVSITQMTLNVWMIPYLPTDRHGNQETKNSAEDATTSALLHPLKTHAEMARHNPNATRTVWCSRISRLW